ncbi:MAG: SDR family oxidoreductase [Pseudomonadota bacterium]
MKVLLTGGTGFLGEYLLAELLEREHAVWALYRNESRRLATIRFLESLGLPRNAADIHWLKCELLDLNTQWDALRRQNPGLDRVDTLLHNAASTRLHMDRYGEPLRTNLGGAKVLTRFADRIAVQTHIISTAYVCGLVRGGIVREINHPRGNFVNVYEESKWEAERLWHGKATLLRPSIIVGHSETARCTSFTGWYILFQAAHLLDRLLRESTVSERLNLGIDLPADSQAATNIVPVDYVAKAALTIIENSSNHNGIFHLTHPDPPSHEWTLKLVQKRFKVGGIRFSGTGATMTQPRNPIERMVYSQLKTILLHFSNNPIFDRSNTDRATPGLQAPPITEERASSLLDYAIAWDWGQSRR